MTGREWFIHRFPDEKKREEIEKGMMAHLKEMRYPGYYAEPEPKPKWKQDELFYEEE